MLSGDEQGVIFSLLCNTFDPGLAVAFSSASSELRALTNEPRQRLRAGHEAAAAFCHKVGMRSCKVLREAKNAIWVGKNLSSADLTTLGNLDLVLPALERLVLYESSPGPEGMERLFEKLGMGALPALTSLHLDGLPLGDTGASALAAALGRGALPRLRNLQVNPTPNRPTPTLTLTLSLSLSLSLSLRLRLTLRAYSSPTLPSATRG